MTIRLDMRPAGNQGSGRKFRETTGEIFDRFISTRDIGPERTNFYMRVRDILIRYEILSGKSMQTMTCDDLESLYEQLINRARSGHKKMSRNYICTIFKALRAFFNWCVRTGVLAVSPFADYKIPTEVYGSPVYLTKEDMIRIMNADLSDRPALEVQRDIFIFQCNVGCRVGDMMMLTKRDVIRGVIEYIPRKTIKTRTKTVSVPLNRNALRIIDRYRNLPGDRLLPFISCRNYNEAIKKVFTLAGVDHMVTVLDSRSGRERKVPINKIAGSHMARRTFVGNIYRSVKDPTLVSSMTGHSEGSRSFYRYREIDIDMKREMVRLLED